jgi:pimeloyl-ACP methyl ester carboxylesterase
VRVNPDLLIHYEEAGSGTPIVFIPGWSSSTEYSQRQFAHFLKNYRAITFDPRSQGLSSKTLENNRYLQHGADLKAFLDALQLKDDADDVLRVDAACERPKMV